MLSRPTANSALWHVDLFSASALASLRSWPAPAGSAERAFALAWANRTREALRSRALAHVFAPACEGQTNASGGAFVDRRRYYHIQLNTSDLTGAAGLPFAAFAAEFATAAGGGERRAAIDGCSGFACNFACDYFGQCSACGRTVR